MAQPDYDLFLGSSSSLTGFRVRSLTRDTAPLVAPRFSSGQQGQTDLDLLKSSSLDDASGGMFQRTHTDNQRAARMVGQFNPYDENLYPTPQFNTFSSSTFVGLANTSYFQSICETDLYTFVAVTRNLAGTTYNRLFRINKNTTTWTEITLPAALASGALVPPITDLSIHKNFLYVSGQSSSGVGTYFNNHRYNYAANTWQDISGYGAFMRPLMGTLYHINTTSNIFSVTNETAAGAATYTVLDMIGISDPFLSCPNAVEEFNGALWIAKPEGLFRWDGVRAVKVLPFSIYYMKTFNGALYFMSGAWLYRFNGTSVEKIQFFGSSETVTGLSASPDYLLISTKVGTGGYPTLDKTTGSITAGTLLIRTYTYDARSFYIVDERVVNYTGAGWATPAYVGGLIMIIYTDASNNAAWYASSPYSTIATTSQLEVTTSEFDDGFPNVYKSLEMLDLNYSDIVAGDSLIVSYQLYDGKAWSSWYTAGTITSLTANTLEITSNKLFKRLRVNVRATLTAASTLKLKGVSWRYTLQPRVRWRWQALLMAEGNSTTFTRNKAAITTDANDHNNIITTAIKQKTPLFMLAPDYGRIKTGVNAAAVSFIVKGRPPLYTDPYGEYPLCAVKNGSGTWELFRVYTVSYNAGSDETTITVMERGYYGVTAASISADAEFRLAYKVYVNRLVRDAPILDEKTYNEQTTTGESQLQREFLLEITEV